MIAIDILFYDLNEIVLPYQPSGNTKFELGQFKHQISKKISPEELLVTNLTLHIFNLLTAHNLSPPVLYQICFALHHRPIYPLLIQSVLLSQEVLILFHESIVHLRRRPFGFPMIKFNQPKLHVLPRQIFTYNNSIQMSLRFLSLLLSF